jgi:hypothetical protein
MNKLLSTLDEYNCQYFYVDEYRCQLSHFYNGTQQILMYLAGRLKGRWLFKSDALVGQIKEFMVARVRQLKNRK